MKTLSLTSAGLLLISFALNAQTIIRVNNNAGVTGTNVYTTIQAAHDAATNGDIILVEPSATEYGTLKCSKSLKIYGNGYYLNGSIKANNLPSKLGNVDFVPGSSGSEISGCETGWFWIQAVSDITITRNRCTTLYIECVYQPGIGSAQYASVTDVIFSQNFGSSVQISGTTNSSITYTASDFSIHNNSIGSINAYTHVAGGLIKFNTIDPGSISLSNIVFENNIVISSTTAEMDVTEPLSGSFTASNSSFNYNVTSAANLFPATLGTGNQKGVDLSLHFIASGPNDTKYKLRDDSSLKTAGSGGAEVGMFGGPTPYIFSGVPSIPSIKNLSTTGTGSNTVPITVTFGAKSHN